MPRMVTFRADVAHLMLRVLDHAASVKQTGGVAN